MSNWIIDDGVFSPDIHTTLSVTAPTKSGQSLFMLDLALSISSGSPWLGIATRKTRCALVDSHNATVRHRRGLIRDHYGDPTRGRDLVIHNLVTTSGDREKARHDAFEALDRDKPDLLFLDLWDDEFAEWATRIGIPIFGVVPEYDPQYGHSSVSILLEPVGGSFVVRSSSDRMRGMQLRHDYPIWSQIAQAGHESRRVVKN